MNILNNVKILCMNISVTFNSTNFNSYKHQIRYFSFLKNIAIKIC